MQRNENFNPKKIHWNKKNIKRPHLKNKKVGCPSINLLLEQGHKPIMSNEKSINDSVKVNKKCTSTICLL